MAGERPRPLVAGNWKMNGLKGSIQILGAISEAYAPDLAERVDLLVCPPATLVHSFAVAAAGSRIAIGGQDAHADTAGAFTGNVSAEMLADLGASHVILGHSERRALHGETDAVVRAKALAAYRAGLVAIVCVGETRDERESGRAIEVVARQIQASVPEAANAANTIIAYEPVWAIGTGLTPTPADIAEVHARLRDELAVKLGPETSAGLRILYGGSVKPGNARELLSIAHVDGALVGGASLVADDFIAIASAYLD